MSFHVELGEGSISHALACVCIAFFIHELVHMGVYVYMCVCMYTCICVCVCMYICICV